MDDLEKRIMRHEGFVAIPEPDARGFYVVGYGHDIPAAEIPRYRNGITKNDALILLRGDIAHARSQVNRACPWVSALDEVRAGVLYEMCFQLGINGMLAFGKMLAAVQAGDYDRAADEMAGSLWHRQTPGRCEALAGLMRHGGPP